MNDGERMTAARRLCDKMFVEAGVAANLNLDDVKAAIASIDDTFDALPATLDQTKTIVQNINARLAEPFKSTATVPQKGMAVAFAAMKRGGMIFDMALVFNGTTQLASAAVAPATAVPLTLAAWAKRAAGSLGGVMELAQNPAGFDYFFLRFNADGTCRARARSLLNLGTADAPDVLGTGVWGHVAGVFGSSTSRYCYLNGVAGAEESSDVTPLTLTTTRIAWETGGDYYFDGELAHVCIWNAALSTAELLELARGASPLGIRPGNLVAYWPMLGADSLVIDESGNRNDLTPANSPTLAADGPPVGWRSIGRIYVPVEVEAGVTVTPTTLALTLATFAPTVSAPRLVTPTTAALTLTTFAPTVSLPILAVPTTKALVLSTFAPTVTTTGHVTATPTTLALTLTAFAPTVLTPRLVTPTTVSLVLSTFAPTVTIGGPQLVTPATIALTLTTFAPVVSGNVVVVPTTKSLTLGTFAPTVTATTWTSYGDSVPYTAANWAGVVFVFQATMSADSGTVYARAYNETDEVAVAGSLLSTSSATVTRQRTPSVSLTDGKVYRSQFYEPAGSVGWMQAAKLLGIPT